MVCKKLPAKWPICYHLITNNFIIPIFGIHVLATPSEIIILVVVMLLYNPLQHSHIIGHIAYFIFAMLYLCVCDGMRTLCHFQYIPTILALVSVLITYRVL